MSHFPFFPIVDCLYQAISLTRCENGCVGDHGSHDVGVHVGRRSSVFDVAFAFGGTRRGRDAHRSSAVSEAVGELVHAGGLVVAGETLFVIVPVHQEMELMLSCQLVANFVNVLHAFCAFAHSLRRVIRVTARAVPVGKQLGGKGHVNVVVLSDSAEQVASHPEMISHLQAQARTDLEFPLAGHDLAVRATDLDAGVEASLVVHVCDNAAEAVSSSDRAVVGSLRAWVAIAWPAERPGGKLGKSLQQGVLLLNAEPGLFSSRLVKDGLCVKSEVRVAGDELRERGIFPDEALGHDHDVVSLAEGVTEVSDRLQNDFRILGGRLVS